MMTEEEMRQWSGILVYVECRKGNVRPVSLELIGKARELAAMSGDKVYAAGAGAELEQVRSALEGYLLEKVFLYDAPDEYTPVLYEHIMADCIRQLRPSVVLIGGTHEGRALAPRLAVEFRTGLTADCTSLDIDENGNLLQTRPAFGGNVMASILTAHRRPQFATVRPGIMDGLRPSAGKKTEFYIRKWQDADCCVSVEQVTEQLQCDGIVTQDILVAAGRGVKKKEDLEMLRDLAQLLGGGLACSRALVEKGWMDPSRQIGLSGNTVSPQWLITCGVSGTVQFMAGMKTAKNIIAINSDPGAGIFGIAHYPVCGDLYEVVPELIRRLRKEKMTSEV